MFFSNTTKFPIKMSWHNNTVDFIVQLTVKYSLASRKVSDGKLQQVSGFFQKKNSLPYVL